MRTRIYLLGLLLFPVISHASFIESTVGTAVVNDATAAYYNPAALTILQNPQMVALGSFAYFHTDFTGQSVQSATGFIQSGSAVKQTHYFLPSLYLGIPNLHHFTAGFAIISNNFNSDINDNSILRYAQSSSSIQSIDWVPAFGYKINDVISLGAGINFSYARFLLEPILGFPGLNFPDTQSRNDCSGTGVGGDVGFLLKPTQSTLIGFNYHSAVTYGLSGKSIFESHPQVVSNQYSFHFWTPARSVLSINQFITPSVGLIGTIQRIQWSIFQNVNIHGIATQIGSEPMIVNGSVPFYMHNTWVLTLGSYYHVTQKWVVRVAGTYNQSPGNSHYQIANGNSIILGASMGYHIYKNIMIDGSYAHAFIQNENITITTGRNRISGVNTGYRNAVSLKLTLNV